MLADRAHQLGPGQTARLDRFLNVSDFLRSELAPGQKFRCSISDQLAAAPDRPPYHLKTVFACPLLFRDKIILHSGLSCSDLVGKQTIRQPWHSPTAPALPPKPPQITQSRAARPVHPSPACSTSGRIPR